MASVIVGAVLLVALALGLAGALGARWGQWSGRQATQQELRIARLLHEAAVATATCHNLHEALGVILERTAKGLDATGGAMYLCDGSDDLQFVHAVGIANSPVWGQVKRSDPLVAGLSLEGQPVVVSTEEAGLAWASPFDNALESTLVIISFGARPKHFGVLVLAWRSRSQAEAATETVLGVAQIAGHALAVFEQVEQRRREFQLLMDGMRHLETISTTLAHDMGNTLTIFSMRLGLQVEEGAPEQRQSAEELLGHLDVLRSLRADLMSLGRPIPHRPQRVPARSILELLPGLVAQPAKRAELPFTLQVPDDLPDMWAERIGLLRVLSNLTQNAVRYNRPGGRMWVKARQAGSWIEWEVGDAGIGIPAEALPHLFEFGYRMPGHERKSKQGHGIGLWSSRLIVEAHGGRIWATSLFGEGSRFFFTVPVAPPSECLASSARCRAAHDPSDVPHVT